tara:strand:+ start:1505 stop:1651 length:147 start_codon:yes stop_codon:yes gene_type:complete
VLFIVELSVIAFFLNPDLIFNAAELGFTLPSLCATIFKMFSPASSVIL